MKVPVIALTLVGILTFVGCGKPAEKGGDTASTPAAVAQPKEGTPLATVGGETVITLEEYREKLMKQSPFLRARYDTVERKKEFLDNMVRVELLAREAMRRGLDKDPEVQESLKKIMVQRLIRQLFEEADEGKLGDVSEEQMRAFYEEHIDDYVKPERVRVSHVFVQAPAGDAAARSEARKKAQAVLKEVRAIKPQDVTAFNTLVREKSDDGASRAVGGDLRYLSKEDMAASWGAPLAEAAFALENVGDLSGVVESDKGFHVVKLTGRQKALDRSFDQVKPTIKQRLSRQNRTDAFEQFIENLKKKENVQLDEALLKEVDVLGGTVSPKTPHGVGRPVPAGKPALKHGKPAAPGRPIHGKPAAPAEPAHN